MNTIKYSAEQIETAAKSLGFQNSELMLAHFTTTVIKGGLYEELNAAEKVFNGFTRAELDAAFKAVQPAQGWKFPINAVIEASAREVTEAAIGFYVGGGATFKVCRGEKLRVTAPGYYLTIGA